MKPRFTPNDANQGEIVKGLAGIPGLAIIDLTEVGSDCPDLIVGYGGFNYFVEIKTETGKLKFGQKRHFKDWPGQTAVARSLDDVLRIIGLL